MRPALIAHVHFHEDGTVGGFWTVPRFADLKPSHQRAALRLLRQDVQPGVPWASIRSAETVDNP